MIRVERALPPVDFDQKVRTPGLAYLASVPAGTKISFKGKEYWRRILRELHVSYGGICAYTCSHIPLDTGADTVEHFRPSSRYPEEAYDWDNYRLVCSRLNGRKGDSDDVVDPFEVEDGMFEINFPSMLLKPGNGIERKLTTLALSTIDRLKLNDERCVGARLEYVMSYSRNQITFDYLESHSPFVAYELERQGLSECIASIMTV